MDNHLILYILLIFGISLCLTMLALVDIIRKDSVLPKLNPVALRRLIPLIGWLFYLILGYRKGRKSRFLHKNH